MNSGLFVDREGERMQVLADHAYHVLVIAFVAATVIEVIVKAVRKPRKKKRGPVAPRESAAEREKRRVKGQNVLVLWRLFGLLVRKNRY